MAEYGKLKNAELEVLLKERGLPHSGKKADMVARLQEDDSTRSKANQTETAETIKASKPSEVNEANKTNEINEVKETKETAETTKATENITAKEDEIDWDDEAATDGIKSALPQDITTNSSEIQTAPDTSLSESVALVAEPIEAETAQTDAPSAEPLNSQKDFLIGLDEISIDDEIAKRKARAAKFGLSTDEPLAQEAMKQLERQRKFGGAAGPRGLNEALPDRKFQRRHNGPDVSDRVNKYHGRRGRDTGRRRSKERAQGKNNYGARLSAADRVAADARKARFG